MEPASERNLTMNDEKFQKENPLLFWFFVVAGVLLIVLSFVMRSWGFDSIWVDVMLNVGASLIATAGIAYLYQQFGTNSLSYYLEKLLHNFSITQKAMELGIQEMWRERRHIPNDMWNTFTSPAISDVWLMGIAELGFAEDPEFRKIVSAGSERGCNFKFLLLDPDSDALVEVDEREGSVGLVPGRIRRSLQYFGEIQKENEPKKGKVEIRVYSLVPQVSIVRSDNEMLITPYLFYRKGKSCFTFHLSKISGGIGDQYIEYFEKIWENAHSLQITDTKE